MSPDETRRLLAVAGSLAAREADLLPVGYFHVVFTLPVAIADIAYHVYLGSRWARPVGT